MDWMESGYPSKKNDLFFETIDEDLDLALALSLQEELNAEANCEVLTKEALAGKGSSVKPSTSSKPIGIVDEQWELIDPHPDIHALFLQYNDKFFYGKLLGVEVKWSPRMTLCAGVCSYEGRGGLCSVRLSSPLLKLRPRRDLVETLLHEMIHAYLFVTANNKDHDAHGPEFCSHMHRINKETGTKISVYHSFHDEVDHFRKHIWKCNGPCKDRRPYYGEVKRAMNRAPGPKDRWWAQHQQTCGGTFIKIKEPTDYKQKQPKKKQAKENATGIQSFFPSIPSTSKAQESPTLKNQKGKANIHTIKSIFEKESNLVPVDSSSTSIPQNSSPNNQTSQAFSGKGFTLGSSSSSSRQPMSLLSEIRREIGYPHSQAIKHRTPGNILPTLNTIQSSKDVIPKTSVQSSKDINQKISAQSSQSAKPKSFVKPVQSVKSKTSVHSVRSVISKTSVLSSQVTTLNKKTLQDSKDSYIKKGQASFLVDPPSCASNTPKRKLLQSSIDSFVTSPEATVEKRPNQGGSISKSVKIERRSDLVTCPVCLIGVIPENINSHLDSCLNKSR